MLVCIMLTKGYERDRKNEDIPLSRMMCVYLVNLQLFHEKGKERLRKVRSFHSANDNKEASIHPICKLNKPFYVSLFNVPKQKMIMLSIPSLTVGMQ